MSGLEDQRYIGAPVESTGSYQILHRSPNSSWAILAPRDSRTAQTGTQAVRRLGTACRAGQTPATGRTRSMPLASAPGGRGRKNALKISIPLVATSEVVVEDFGPPIMAQSELDYLHLIVVRPALVGGGGQRGRRRIDYTTPSIPAAEGSAWGALEDHTSRRSMCESPLAAFLLPASPSRHA
jgi:hypothetical protein